jgi:hypothetical protein
VQNQADFYRESYETSLRHMSNDRELATFWDVGGSTDVSVAFGPLSADARVGAIYYKFDNFPKLRRRTALLAGGGAKVVW